MENKPSTLQTRITLLRRLQQDDHVAWDELVALYGPCICQWYRQWRLQEADMPDVTQGFWLSAALAVLLVLAVLLMRRSVPEKGTHIGAE
jgi:hypothetical protein